MMFGGLSMRSRLVDSASVCAFRPKPFIVHIRLDQRVIRDDDTAHNAHHDLRLKTVTPSIWFLEEIMILWRDSLGSKLPLVHRTKNSAVYFHTVFGKVPTAGMSPRTRHWDVFFFIQQATLSNAARTRLQLLRVPPAYCRGPTPTLWKTLRSNNMVVFETHRLRVDDAE